MPKEVDVKIDRRGRVETDFKGFRGVDCLEEAERLRRVLVGLGLEIEVTEARQKTDAEIMAEIGESEDSKTGVRTDG